MVVTSFAVMLACAGISAETPSVAVILAAADGSAAALRIPAGVFRALPKPGPGMSFAARLLPTDARGRRRFRVEAWHDGRLVATGDYTFGSRRAETIVVAQRRIARGAVIGPADVTTAPYEGSSAGLYAQTIESVVGRVARYDLAPGARLRTNATRRPFLVRSGDPVRVNVRVGRLTVTLKGVAVGSARRGERVEVRNARSRRIVEAVVTGAREAEVRNQ